ncbi:MAG TPA: MarR family transcriptional regulator [Streptosporangiaceae bacterium]|jgi:DNA-binding Lrp family transcriptional regulator
MSWDLPGTGLPGRAGLEATFEQSMRRTSSLVQLMSQAAADRIGINATDLNCLNILSLGGTITAGQLAQATGLTTASITGVIDRLEEAGYVRRERHAGDRRRVVIHLILEPVLRDVVPVFAPMIATWQQVAAEYSDAELELILGFQAKTVQALRDQLARLRQPADKAASPA